tara:strand:- start:20 stop:136 length:117 start_codon:yes stop_codon:yes gene_type:complete
VKHHPQTRTDIFKLIVVKVLIVVVGMILVRDGIILVAI